MSAAGGEPSGPGAGSPRTSGETGFRGRGPRRPARSRVLVGGYLALAAVGLVGTWWFNLSFMSTGGGGGYLAAWFANDASSSAAVDIIVAGVAACVLMVVEGRRLGWGVARIATLVVLGVAVAVAFTFPLFLALRERDRERRYWLAQYENAS